MVPAREKNIGDAVILVNPHGFDELVHHTIDVITVIDPKAAIAFGLGQAIDPYLAKRVAAENSRWLASIRGFVLPVSGLSILSIWMLKKTKH
jgi:hypothetical protein